MMGFPADISDLKIDPEPEPPYRVGRSLGTTIYRRGESQPCGWFPNDPALALTVVKLLNKKNSEEPQVSQALIHALKSLGDTYGPMGVALVAADLTNREALIDRLEGE